MKKKWRTILIVLIIIAVLIIIYPKNCGYGPGGLIPVNVTLHSEKCTCLGARYTAVGGRFNMFGFMTCADCGPSYYCIGFPIGKKCYETIFDENRRFSDPKEVECNSDQNNEITENSCENDNDCACGVWKSTGECAVGNKYFIDVSRQCPDFCSGIAGNLRVKCVNKNCGIVSPTNLCNKKEDCVVVLNKCTCRYDCVGKSEKNYIEKICDKYICQEIKNDMSISCVCDNNVCV